MRVAEITREVVPFIIGFLVSTEFVLLIGLYELVSVKASEDLRVY
jgi:hypothetical protein